MGICRRTIGRERAPPRPTALGCYRGGDKDLKCRGKSGTATTDIISYFKGRLDNGLGGKLPLESGW